MNEQTELWRLSVNGVAYRSIFGPDGKLEHVTGSEPARKTEERAKAEARELQASRPLDNVRLRLVTTQTVLYGEDD